MVVFLANRANLQSKRLHDRIANQVRSEFSNVRRRRAEPRDQGPYRVVGEMNPRAFLEDHGYPTEEARIEIGFQLRTDDPYEHYWINWIEPERGMLVGWHQDDTHNDLGPVHVQVNDGSTVVAHESARFIDSHPLDVVGQRIGILPLLVEAVQWDGNRPIGLHQFA
jgi:hypothetical protein